MIRSSSYLLHEGSGLPLGTEAGGIFLSPPIKATGDGSRDRREVMSIIIPLISLDKGNRVGYNPGYRLPGCPVILEDGRHNKLYLGPGNMRPAAMQAGERPAKEDPRETSPLEGRFLFYTLLTRRGSSRGSSNLGK